ncbi:MAG: hypothetical protein WBA31_04175 [Candidatus Dormiibacterota bacterium]
MIRFPVGGAKYQVQIGMARICVNQQDPPCVAEFAGGEDRGQLDGEPRATRSASTTRNCHNDRVAAIGCGGYGRGV